MVSCRKQAEAAGRTSSTCNGDNEPIKMHISEGFNITEAVPKNCKSVVGDEDRLNKFDNVEAIDKIFCKFTVPRKCQIVQI